MKKRSLFVALAFLFLGLIFYLGVHRKTRMDNNQGPSCDVSLWAHVYHGRFKSAGERLYTIDRCVTVTGTIMNGRREKDGDWHIQLDLDAEFRSMLNEVNLGRQNGYLVLEPMCSNPVSQHDTVEEGVCVDFSQTIFDTGLIGKRVSVTGAYVIDREHGWTEIHPATSIVSIQ